MVVKTEVRSIMIHIVDKMEEHFGGPVEAKITIVIEGKLGVVVHDNNSNKPSDP
jgi:hypothetical protein